METWDFEGHCTGRTYTEVYKYIFLFTYIVSNRICIYILYYQIWFFMY